MVSRAHHISLARVRKLKKSCLGRKDLSNASCDLCAYSAHPQLNSWRNQLFKYVLQEIRKMNRYSGAMKCFAASCALSVFPLASFAQNYVQNNLVSDIQQPANADGTSVIIDAHLKNAWGLARGAASPWWVNNNGTGTSTLYNGAGAITP